MEKNNEKTITPSQYFDFVKGAKNNITSEELKKNICGICQIS